MDTNSPYTIQQVAEQTGLTVHTLRYYERICLLDQIGRARSGHRRYSEQDIARIQFLNRLRSTGMPIRQMQEYVQGGPDERRALLEAHRQTVLNQMAELEQSIEAIDWKIALYSGKVAEGVGEFGPIHSNP